MKTIKLIIALLLLGLAGVGNTWADRGHGHFDVMIGPYWGPRYYAPPPLYYYPPYYPPMVVLERPEPQVYIEQQPATVAPAAPVNYWYYCTATKAYYPYVKECPGGWKRELPQPPGLP